MGAKQDLVIDQGKTFSRVLRWEAPPIIYKPITGVSQAAPAVVTCPDHELPNGWRVAVVSVRGMTQINAELDAAGNPKATAYRQATVIDADTVQLNTVNSAGFTAYQGGGYLQFNTPVSLAGFTARMSIRDKIGGTEIISLTTVNNRIILDDANKTITLQIASADTALLTFSKKATYDLEMVSPTGIVTGLLYGAVTLNKEVTT